MISVVLATYNEENNIQRCLDSVKSFADEVVVVDGSSSDNTAALAAKLGARVITTTNKSNFHINKQMAMDAATGSLVLQLDADEVVDSELREFITGLSSQLNSRSRSSAVAWYIKRKNYFLGRFLSKGGQYPDPVIRLYINGKARLPQENVHEQMSVEGDVGTAEGHLQHFPYPNFAVYMKKFNTYTSFEAERLHQKKASLTTTLAWQYLLFKPLQSFFSIFLRHKGFVDGMAGFTFALMSSLHHPFVYLKLKEQLK